MMSFQSGVPRSARGFFFWIATAVLLMVGSLQIYQSQQYFRNFGPLFVNCSHRYCLASGLYGQVSLGLPGQKTFYGVPADESSVVQDGWQPHPIIPPSIARPRLVVVVSSAPRSGSSFLGQLMSSQRGALYLFEPFWFYKHLYNNKTAAPYNYTAASDLYNLLTCNLDALPPMFAERRHSGFIWRKPKILKRDPSRVHLTSLCLSTSIRVIKTIRPRLANVLPLLKRTDLDVRIIHLVRDPRAIHNSLLTKHHAWPQRRRNATLLCEDIRADLRASQSINSDRWTGVSRCCPPSRCAWRRPCDCPARRLWPVGRSEAGRRAREHFICRRSMCACGSR
ncbi:carbohydrate sulfotransferase 3-like isoform X2 [Amphibalanus amphitrite]|uniref:carbohydrate sulfotransferase 3-like isoform X2 n=1 Tax=Amphibalanus amphitrite TaxID=1232801 RepID=UPI001C90C479|nr:carbohydrate sulfotransferase 3-like isoform X2 [Amphibalanus amphitrite]